MRNLLAAIALVGLFCLPGWATVVDLRPNALNAGGWTVGGDGTGDCNQIDTPGVSGRWGCVNSDVESPEDSTYLGETSPGGDSNVQVLSFQDAPGDCGSVNSITLKIRTNTTTATGEDGMNVWLSISGTQSGGTKRIDEWTGTANCNLSGTGTSNCSFTDSTWNSWTCGDVTDGRIHTQVFTNNQGMPDNSTYRNYEIELVLDYNVAGAAPNRRHREVVLE